MNILCVHREGESWGALIANPRMSQLSDGSLQIRNASRNDSSQYTCTVSNSKITITAELDVLSELYMRECSCLHAYLIYNWFHFRPLGSFLFITLILWLMLLLYSDILSKIACRILCTFQLLYIIIIIIIGVYKLFSFTLLFYNNKSNRLKVG